MVARALLVGVSETTWEAGRFPRLAGVAVDIKRMEHFLGAKGFNTVRQADCREKAVKAALIEVVSNTARGDVTVIYLTGHGYQVKDRDGDEVDGWDEAFVCADQPILDDWFRQNLWTLAIDGARFVSIVDACHSDTITLGLRAEDVDPPTTKPITARGFYRLTLAASRDEQETIDLGPTDDGGGIVTRAIVDGLKNQSLSYRDLWRQAANSIAVGYPNRGIGIPTYDSWGPDDTFLWSQAFLPM